MNVALPQAPMTARVHAVIAAVVLTLATLSGIDRLATVDASATVAQAAAAQHA